MRPRLGPGDIHSFDKDLRGAGDAVEQDRRGPSPQGARGWERGQQGSAGRHVWWRGAPTGPGKVTSKPGGREGGRVVGNVFKAPKPGGGKEA